MYGIFYFRTSKVLQLCIVFYFLKTVYFYINVMFNNRIKIKELLSLEPQGQEVIVMGWVRTFRNNQFVALNDGSTNNNVQVVLELGKFPEEVLKRITTSAAIKVKGTVVASL